MSFHYLAWAQSFKTGAPSTKAVLMALCSICNDDGICWPSQKRIASDAEMSEKTVWTCMQKLEAAGIITRERRSTTFGHRISDLITINQIDKSLTVTVTPRDESLTVNIAVPNRNSYDAEPVIEPVISNNITRVRRKSQNTDFPENFYLDQATQRVADNLGMTDNQVSVEIECMRDWSANAGPKGFKKNWQAFARNWFRNNFKKGKPNGSYQNGHKPGTVADGFAKVRAVIAEAERRENEGNGTVGEENDVSVPRLWQGSA
jgi:biotin operon repressor